MSDRTLTVIWLYAISAAILVAHTGFFVYGGYTYQGRDSGSVGAMVALGAVGGGLFIGATLIVLYSIYEVRGGFLASVGNFFKTLGSIFSFGGKVALGVWGVAMTIAVAFLFYHQFIK